MGHNDKRAGEVVYEILKRFGAGAVAGRFGSSGGKHRNWRMFTAAYLDF